MITLSHEEMRIAAAVLDTYRAEGLTSLGAMAAAVNAVNRMRTPGRTADCATCPGHVKAQGVSR
ncbi:hypothetical protein SEA_ILLUMINE_51 [Mycobacterium phage Illumine]|nr:hypothetical protein SEA_DOLE_51 [Mycobacterium phage Dole]UDL14724.1 hypothetical protein SEA_DEVERA_53 [Mycobacterium phage Devera]UDL14988.1 hypothetical protein SEA_ILLUMINE_51 [Mycobacterium phage Illumine]